MSWQDKHSKQPIVSVAPQWFEEAKRLGASEKKLRELVQEHCQALTPEEPPSAIWVELMFQMYDNGCAEC